MLIKLASLQTSFVTLDEALKVTNRRVNALENVTIPKIDGVLDYIARELDELEREGKKCAHRLHVDRNELLLFTLANLIVFL
jgi:vacuolar-type H+-ATPase subunit D/Vma8